MRWPKARGAYCGRQLYVGIGKELVIWVEAVYCGRDHLPFKRFDDQKNDRIRDFWLMSLLPVRILTQRVRLRSSITRRFWEGLDTF